MDTSKFHDHTGWITAVILGRWCQAKIYNEGSEFGINGGRVSKLVIGKSSEVVMGGNFFDQMAYNYDRGLDFDNLPTGVLDDIVGQLEALPKLVISQE